MRCPKCHYLSFEPEPRCKNCGYDLSIPDADLSLKAFEPDGPAPPDLALRVDPLPAARQSGNARSALDSQFRSESPRQPMPAPRAPRKAGAVASSVTALMTEEDAAPAAVPARSDDGMPDELMAVLRRAESRTAPPTSELPLFVKGMTQVETPAPEPEPEADPGPVFSPRVAPSAPEVPMLTAGASAEAADVLGSMRSPLAAITDADDLAVHVPAAPTPLAVRRKAPDSGAQRPRSATPARKLGPLDRDLLEDLQRIEKAELRDAAVQARREARESDTDRAGAGRRITAAAIDAAFLGGLSAAVLWITLRWCELPLESARILPIVPTSALLLLMGAFYLVMFTAFGGQTIGKMALGLRVIGAETPDDPAAHLTLGQATYRSVLTLPSVLVLGAGFIPALMGDERAFHDRLAHTRVVRA